jgi:pimeloyl-ACP methyl ester carboxylesterase
MKKLSVNGISLNFLEINPEQKQTIVFLHGNSHSLKSFSKQINSPLLKDFRLVFVDFPGHGESSKGSEYSIKIFAQIIAELIKTLEINKFIVAGHSLGGHVAINLLNTPVIPSGLFLFGTPPLKNPFDVAAFLPNSKISAIGKINADYEEISTLMDEMNYVGNDKKLAIEDFLITDGNFRVDILGDIDSGKNANEVELIKSFNAPVMFLLATKDSMINNSYIRKECFLNLGHVQTSEIEAGHSPQVEMDVDFNQILAEFSKQVFNRNLELTYNKLDLQHERRQNEQRN